MNRFKYASLILLAFVLLLGQPVKADEGMWLPMLIGKNYEQMKKQGFKLTPEDLYSVNKASIKMSLSIDCSLVTNTVNFWNCSKPSIWHTNLDYIRNPQSFHRGI